MENHATKRIMHVTRPGHRCTHGLKVKAADFKAGMILQHGDWELSYWQASPTTGAYFVQRDGGVLSDDVYEFSNLNCAAAKLAELGEVKQ